MKSILIVDEDAFTRNVFAHALSGRGFAVTLSNSGGEALRVLSHTAVDAVVVGATLPDMAGAAFVRSIRAQNMSTRVVFLASVLSTESLDVEELTEKLNVSLILQKPISPIEFCERLEAILDPSIEQPSLMREADGLDTTEVSRLVYRETVEADLNDVEQLVSGIRGGGTSFDLAQGAIALLRATASRHGFFGISRAVAEIERRLAPIQERGEGDDAAWADVQDAIDRAFVAARSFAEVEPPDASTTMTVLVVDDDRDFLERLQQFGREHLIQVVTAGDAEAVIDKMRDPALDGLLVDVDLGNEFDTFEFVARLRERSGSEPKPLGFLADRGTVPDRVMAAHLGACVFAEKPIDSAQFAEIVHRLVTAQNRGKRPLVAVVDTDLTFIRTITDMLHHAQMDVHHVDGSAELIERIDAVTPDGLIMNVTMPGIGGLDLCRMVRAMPRWYDLPILLVGDRMDPPTRIAAFRAGADDYLLKPPIREELLARLEVRIQRLRLLREQASIDMLTGLLSRRPFLQRVNARISEARRGGRKLALSILDLDGFKAINDTYGHLTGDRVLAALGRLLTNRFRIEDLRGRWGGEEFVVALIGEEASTAERVLQRTLEEFRVMEFVGDQGERFNVTFSAGIAVFPQDGEAFRELLTAADRRLYVAKAQGKNCIVA